MATTLSLPLPAASWLEMSRVSPEGPGMVEQCLWLMILWRAWYENMPVCAEHALHNRCC